MNIKNPIFLKEESSHNFETNSTSLNLHLNYLENALKNKTIDDHYIDKLGEIFNEFNYL